MAGMGKKADKSKKLSQSAAFEIARCPKCFCPLDDGKHPGGRCVFREEVIALAIKANGQVNIWM